MTIRLLALCGVLSLSLVACSGKKPSSSDACPAGQALVDGVCRVLCSGSSQCTTGQSCSSQGVCVDGPSDVPPEITSIDGTGSPDGAANHADHHFDASLAVTGQNLLGATVSLAASDAGLPSYASLTVASGATDHRMEVELPSDILEGNYVLTVANAAGSDQQDVLILQGEQGVQGPQGSAGPAGSVGPPGPPGKPDDFYAICTTASSGAGFVRKGVCVVDYDASSTTVWNTAAAACVSRTADLCSSAQYQTLRRADDLFYNNRAVWTNDFSDNDNGDKSFAIHSDNDPIISSTYSYGCCYNITPEPFRSQAVDVGGIMVTFVHERQDTTWRSAAEICHSRGSDLCTKSEYIILRDNGYFTDTATRLVTSEMSDNDGGLFSAIVGSNTADNPSWTNPWAFACCGNNRPTDGSCPGTLTANGLCLIDSHTEEDADFFTAARACASQGADICSKSQMQALRNLGSFDTRSWTNDGADNDSTRAGGLLGTQPDNPDPDATLMGYACCM